MHCHNTVPDSSLRDFLQFMLFTFENKETSNEKASLMLRSPFIIAGDEKRERRE